jgi:NAD(P)-dependent dehydrogenase (short-subunit alcohol dehydrogenase family)
MSRFDFAGKRVLVTGASRGLGEAIARAFALAGADLFVLADDEGVHAAAAEIGKLVEVRVPAYVCDITDKATVARIVGGLGPLDVLVNNAGLELLTPVLEPSADNDRNFERIIDINVKGSWWVTRAAVPQMKAGASILFTASLWGRTAEAGFAAYVASKHAVIGLTRTLARELGPMGIRVNAVCPGWVRTKASLRSLAAMSKRTGRPESDLLDEILAHQAMGGLMEPDDIADLYLFLASDAARNITGQSVGIDRGDFMA